MDKFKQRTANDVVAHLHQTEKGWELGSFIQLCHRGHLPNDVAWMVWGELGLFDFAELPTVIKVARRMARLKRHVTPGEFRLAACRAVERA